MFTNINFLPVIFEYIPELTAIGKIDTEFSVKFFTDR